MKNFILAIIVLVFGTNEVLSQCNVDAFATSVDVLCGDTVKLSAIGEGVTVFEEDFDNCDFTNGNWESTQSADFTDPCGADMNGTCYLWFGASSPAPRNAVTPALDLSTGGVICWNMRYAVQGQASPCEGIDLPDEGVSLEYSVAGGPWVTISYYGPNGGNDAYRTSWNRYCDPIPAGAMFNNVRIRWIQKAASGGGNDHWGMEDVLIEVNPPGAQYTWQHTGVSKATGDTPPVVPTQTTTYTVDYVFGNCTNQASVTVNVRKLTAVASKNPLTDICPGDPVVLDVEVTEAQPPTNCGLSLTGCVGNTSSISLGTGNIINNGNPVLGKINPNPTSQSCLQLGGYAGNHSKGAWSQFIIRASELSSFFNGGQIYNMQLNSEAVGSWQNFEVKMGCTNLTEFAGSAQADYQTGLATVYTAKNTTFIAGWNVLEFDQAFDWDGASNVVVEICWFGDAAQGNLVKTNVGFNALINTESCFAAACQHYEPSTAGVAQERPNMILGICSRPPSVFDYTWTPSPSLDDFKIKSPTATPSNSTTYTVTVWDMNTPIGCAVTDDIDVNVVPAADFTPSGDSVCVGGNAQLTSGLTAGVVNWVGPNTYTSTDYDPIINAVTLADAGTYSITSDGGGCGIVTKDVELKVVSPPDPGVANNLSICVPSGEVNLFDLLAGEQKGGVWSDDSPSGALRNDSIFDPALLNASTVYPVTYSFTYTLDKNICGPQFSTVQITLSKLPVAGSNNDTTLCETHGDFDLNLLLSSNADANGVWNDVNSTGAMSPLGILTPDGLGEATYEFRYEVAGTAPCPDSVAVFMVTINKQPYAGEDGSAVICQNASISLFPLLQNMPEVNGQWLELTQSGGTLDAITGDYIADADTTGTFTFAYILGATAPCFSDSAFVTLTIHDFPKISNDLTTCVATQDGYIATFEIRGGDENTYNVTPAGTITIGNPTTFASNEIPNNTPETFTISDANGCGDTTITVIKNCKCVTEVGTMKTDTLISLCGPTGTASGIYQGGYLSDGNDTITYYLHEGAGSSLVNVLASSSTPDFTFDANTMNLDQTYYISAGAGDNDGSNNVDQTDVCFIVANGTPVIWRSLPSATIAINKTDICPGEDAEITITAQGSSSPLQVLLDEAGSIDTVVVSSGTPDILTILPIDTTIYSLVKVIDPFGCETILSDQVTINVNEAPIATIIDTSSNCMGASPAFTIDVKGAGSVFDVVYTNSFDNTNTTVNGIGKPGVIEIPTVSNPNDTVVYSLISVTDNSGSICPGAVFGTYLLFPQPTASIVNSDGIYCQGTPVPINLNLTGIGPWDVVIGDGTSQWTFNNVTTPNATVNITGVLPPGNYNFVVDVISDLPSGCSNTGQGAAAAVTINPGPAAEVNIFNNGTDEGKQTTFCDDGSSRDLVFTKVRGTGNVFDITYVTSGASSDTNTVQITDGVSTSFTVTPVVGTNSYHIINVIDGSSAGCQGLGDTAVVIVKALPTVSANLSAGSDTICENTNATLDYTVTGEGTISFDVYEGANFIVAATGTAAGGTQSVSIPTPTVGDHTYEIRNIVDGTTPNCSNTSNAQFNVHVVPLPTATLLIPDIVICEGESVSIDLATTGEGVIQTDYEAVGTDGAPNVSGLVHADVTGTYTIPQSLLTPGIYTFNINNVSDNTQDQCTGTGLGSTVIEVVALPTATLDFVPDSVCEGTPADLVILPSGNGPFDISLADDQGNNFNLTGVTTSGQTIQDAGLSTITYTITSITDGTLDENGNPHYCVAQAPFDNAKLTVLPLPSGSISGLDEICGGETSSVNFNLSGTGPFTVVYEDQFGTQYTEINVPSGNSSVNQSPTDTSNYTIVSITDASPLGCVNTGSGMATINVSPSPVASVNVLENGNCSPFIVELQNTSTTHPNTTLTNCNWSITNQADVSSCGNVNLSLTEVGSYDVTLSVENSAGCSDQRTYPNYLTVHPDPVAEFDFSPEQPNIVESLVQFYNRSTGASQFIWTIDTLASLNSVSPVFQLPSIPNLEYEVCLEAISNFGCRSSYCEIISVDPVQLIYLPNSFTPDGDGLNDVYYPSVEGMVESTFHMTVYDRWGRLVFESFDIDNGWDGSIYGQEEKVQTDVYVVKVTGESIIEDAPKIEVIGEILLLK